MINTLNVATQGHIPNLSSLSVATLGWLGTTLRVFIENNEFVWSLSAQDNSWILANKDEIWFLNKQNINWTINSRDEDWNLYSQKVVWTIFYEMEY